MQLHVVAAVIAVAGLLAGCGFVPKKPAQPDTGRRIPINAAAPFLGPWPPRAPAYAVSPSTLAAKPDIALRPEPGNAIRSIAEQAPSDASQERIPVPGTEVMTPPTEMPPAEETAPPPLDAVWPALLSFKPRDKLLVPPLPARVIRFSWPPAQEAQTLAVGDQAEAEAEAGTLTGSSEVPLAPLPALPPAPQEGKRASGGEVVTVDALEDSEPDRDESNPSDTTELLTAEPIPATRTWSAVAGVTLSDLLREWAIEDNWSVRWESDIDFEIEAPFSIDAPDFLTAADQIFNAYLEAGCTFGTAAYSNNVLVVHTPRICKT